MEHNAVSDNFSGSTARSEAGFETSEVPFSPCVPSPCTTEYNTPECHPASVVSQKEEELPSSDGTEDYTAGCSSMIAQDSEKEVAACENDAAQISIVSESTPLSNEGRRSLRKVRREEAPPKCPVCGLQLRSRDLSLHVHTELTKLQRLTRECCNGTYGRTRDSRKVNRKRSLRHSRGKTKRSRSSGEPTSPGPDPLTPDQPEEEEQLTPQQRYKAYLEIKTNREFRKRKRVSSDGGPKCPVCNRTIAGSPEELADHVEQCLSREEQCDVDVEGGDEVDVEFEEYTWAGQTRVRTSTMLMGGLSGSGFQTGHKKKPEEEDDIDLNVDDDDDETYGSSQYTEMDIIPCCFEEPQEESERLALRKALLNGDNAVHRTELYKWSQKPCTDLAIAGTSHVSDYEDDIPSDISSIDSILRINKETCDRRENRVSDTCTVIENTKSAPPSSTISSCDTSRSTSPGGLTHTASCSCCVPNGTDLCNCRTDTGPDGPSLCNGGGDGHLSPVIPCNSRIEHINSTTAHNNFHMLGTSQKISGTMQGRGGGDLRDVNDTDAASDKAALLRTIASLKAKLRELDHTPKERQRCLICMEAYSVPLVSIRCWHVHCEECWLTTMGAKKLCPQCNTITSATDLRKIYL